MKQLFYILLTFFFVAPAFGATYYMRTDGTAANKAAATGCGAASSAMNEATHNGETFSAGDEIHLCDTGGSYTTDILPPSSGSAGSYITYKNASGDTPVLDQNGSSNPFVVNGKSYIIVDGLTVQDYTGDGILIDSDGTGCHYITVKKCIVNGSGTGGRGIVTRAGSSDPHNTNITIGGASGDGNEVYAVSAIPRIDVAVQRSDIVTISYNKLRGGGGGGDGILTERSTDLLIEYNSIYNHTAEDGIDIKKGSNDVTIRYNHIYGHTAQTGITIQMDSHHVSIYGNSIHDNGWQGIAIWMGAAPYNSLEDMTDIYVWGNECYDNGWAGITVGSSGYGDNGYKIKRVYIYNNTLVRNGDQSAYGGGISVRVGEDHKIYNNIGYNNTNSASEYTQIYIDASIVNEDVDYNWSFYTGQTDVYDYEGTPKNLTEWRALGYDANGDVDNPDMTNPGAGNDVFTLTSVSPCIDTGDDRGLAFDDVLDPTGVTFSDYPPTVAMLLQGNAGAAWEVGAWAYPTSGLTITVTATDATAQEEGTTTGEWTIACIPNCAGETINYAFSGTATLNTDYNCDDEDGTIAITGASDTITLTPVDDAVQDIGEVAILTINTGTGYIVGSPNSASITIEDNDGAQDQGISGITVDASGSGKITYNSSGSGSWTR